MELQGECDMSGQSSIKAEIIGAARRLGADLVGITSSDRFGHAPAGHKPTDIMANAQSVIVLALRCLNGPMKHHHWTSYTVVHEGNDIRLNNMAYSLSCFMEEKYGAHAIPLAPNSPYYDWDEDHQYAAGDLSHKHAAVAAGLGVIGKNSLLITPRYGNKVSLVSIITDIVLEPDALIGQELCPSTCRLCIDACPQQAINGDNTISQTKCRSYCWTKLPRGFSVLHCWACREVCPASNAT